MGWGLQSASKKNEVQVSENPCQNIPEHATNRFQGGPYSTQTHIYCRSNVDMHQNPSQLSYLGSAKGFVFSLSTAVMVYYLYKAIACKLLIPK